jgi:hypothetical protein
VLHAEHIELQRKMLEHSREQNISISKQLEEAVSIVRGMENMLEMN